MDRPVPVPLPTGAAQLRCEIAMTAPAQDALVRVLHILRLARTAVSSITYVDDPAAATAACSLTLREPMSSPLVTRLQRLVGVQSVRLLEPPAAPSVADVSGWSVHSWEVRQTPQVTEVVLRVDGAGDRIVVLADGATTQQAMDSAVREVGRRVGRPEVGRATRRGTRASCSVGGPVEGSVGPRGS